MAEEKERDFAHYAGLEWSPAKNECSLCGEVSSNNSSKMATNKEKSNGINAPKLWIDFLAPGRKSRFDVKLPATKTTEDSDTIIKKLNNDGLLDIEFISMKIETSDHTETFNVPSKLSKALTGQTICDNDSN